MSYNTRVTYSNSHMDSMEDFVDSGGPNLHVDRLSHSNVCGMLGVGEHSAIKLDVKKQLLFGIGNLSLPHDMLSNFGGQGGTHLGVREREIVGAAQSDIR